MQISRHQLQLRVLECRAAVIHQRDPAVEIAAGFILAHVQDIVGTPRQIGGQVGRLHFMAAGA